MSPETFLSSNVWVTKMKTYFKAMDVDRNGFLSLSDYEEIAERLLQNQGEQSNSEEIREVFRSLFEHMVAGAVPVDGETKISEEQFLANAAKVISLIQSSPEAGKSSFEAGKRKNEVLFDLIDTDRSGEISREEYRKYLVIYTGKDDADRADQAFDSIDLDRNGSISRDEFIECHLRYWSEHASDPSSSPIPYGSLVDS